MDEKESKSSILPIGLIKPCKFERPYTIRFKRGLEPFWFILIFNFNEFNNLLLNVKLINIKLTILAKFNKRIWRKTAG